MLSGLSQTIIVIVVSAYSLRGFMIPATLLCGSYAGFLFAVFFGNLWAHFWPLFCTTVSHFWKLLCGMQVDCHLLKWGGVNLNPSQGKDLRVTCFWNISIIDGRTHRCFLKFVVANTVACGANYEYDGAQFFVRVMIMTLSITHAISQESLFLASAYITWAESGRRGGGRNIMWKLCGSYAGLMS